MVSELESFFETHKPLAKELSSSTETLKFGKAIGKLLPDKLVVALFGDLGAGKTTLIKGIVEGYMGLDAIHVYSPTFVTLNIYAQKESRTVHHFDLYRLKSYEEFVWQGFEEYLDKEGICCIEWSEKIASFLPEKRLEIHLQHHLSCEEKRGILLRYGTA